MYLGWRFRKFGPQARGPMCLSGISWRPEHVVEAGFHFLVGERKRVWQEAPQTEHLQGAVPRLLRLLLLPVLCSKFSTTSWDSATCYSSVGHMTLCIHSLLQLWHIRKAPQSQRWRFLKAGGKGQLIAPPVYKKGKSHRVVAAANINAHGNTELTRWQMWCYRICHSKYDK